MFLWWSSFCHLTYDHPGPFYDTGLTKYEKCTVEIGKPEFWINVSFGILAVALCLFALFEGLSRAAILSGSRIWQGRAIFRYLTAVDSEERRNHIFILFLKLLIFLYVLALFLREISSRLTAQCVQDEISQIYVTGVYRADICMWSNNFWLFLSNSFQISLLLLFNLFWFWQYQLTYKNPRPFIYVLFEWLGLSCSSTLLFLLVIMTGAGFQGCYLFFTLPLWINALSLVILTSTFSCGWILFARRFRQFGISISAKTFVRKFFIQSSIVMFIFTYQALFALFSIIFPPPLTCGWAVYQLIEPILVVFLQVIILIFAVSSHESLLYAPLRLCGISSRSTSDEDRDTGLEETASILDSNSINIEPERPKLGNYIRSM